MAPKKPNPMEEPPAASSSEEEEEEGNSSEEVTSSDDEGEEDTQEPTEPSSPPSQQTQKQSAVKKPKATMVTAAPQAKSASSEESESSSESESEPDFTPKPIATKPMEETPKVTKPRSKPVSKRPNESQEAAEDSKRAKKKDLEEDKQKKPGEDTKKQLFQRLWSEDDEIAMLKGMIEYSTKKGHDPMLDMQAFYDYIKKSIHVDVSKTQLVDKVRRLKKKYENNLGKVKKNGEDRNFSKPHEQEAYDLSKKLWGSESTGRVIESAAKPNGKAKKNQTQKVNNNLLATLKAELIDGAKGEMMDVDNDKKGNLVNSAYLKEKENEKVLFDKSLGMAGLEAFVVNDGLDIVGGAKKAELEGRWKKLQIAQLELFLQRQELINDQAKLMLDAMKSSSD